MTQNDKLLLEEYKSVTETFDRIDLAEDSAQHELTYIAAELGRVVRNLQYLEDDTLRAQADIVRLDFGPPSTWPDTREIPGMIRLAEKALIDAI